MIVSLDYIRQWEELDLDERKHSIRVMQQQWFKASDSHDFDNFQGYVNTVTMVMYLFLKDETIADGKDETEKVFNERRFKKYFRKSILTMAFIEKLIAVIEYDIDDELVRFDVSDLTVTYFLLKKFLEDGRNAYPHVYVILDDDEINEAFEEVGPLDLYYALKISEEVKVYVGKF